MIPAMFILFCLGAALLAIAPQYQHDEACAPEVVVACAYCGHRDDDGAFPTAPVSHGICQDCYAREIAALRARQAPDSLPVTAAGQECPAFTTPTHTPPPPATTLVFPPPPPPAAAFVFPGPPLPVQASASVAKPATARPPGGCLLIAIEFIGYLAAGATGLTVLIAHELLVAMLAAITTLLALILIAVCHVGYHLLRTR